jgi:hypothetical protein
MDGWEQINDLIHSLLMSGICFSCDEEVVESASMLLSELNLDVAV